MSVDASVVPEPVKCASGAVIKVGDGRGFVVEVVGDRYVITAAHCLPHFPPCMSFSHTHERTYAKLLGPLGGDLTVWAECLFVDPIGDIAVLGAPDNQVQWTESTEFGTESDEYEKLIEHAGALRIAAILGQGAAWLLGLDGRWMPSAAKPMLRGLLLSDCEIEGGLSGSPILTGRGVAIGVIGTSASGLQGRLTAHLPGWLLPAESARRRKEAKERSAYYRKAFPHLRPEDKS